MRFSRPKLSSSVFLFLWLVTIPILLIACQHTKEIERTPEEIVFGEESVLEMMNLVVRSAADTISQEARWSAMTTQLVPQEARSIVDAVENIPGTRRLLDTYIEHIHVAITSIAKEIPRFFEQEIQPNLTIEDPYDLIEGNNDAVTRLFASRISPSLEAWIVDQLEGYTGEDALNAWKALLRVYNTYVISQNNLKPNNLEDRKPIIEASPVQTVMVTLLREFIGAMTTQEALLRTMAPAYDDPRIMLFSSP